MNLVGIHRVPHRPPLVISCTDQPPTHHGDVRPILEGRCVFCHAEGAIAPFALDDSATVQFRFQMHQLGTRGSASRLERGFPPILEVDRWDFDWQ